MAETLGIPRDDSSTRTANGNHEPAVGIAAREHQSATYAGEHAPPEPFRVLLICEFFEPGFRAGGPIRSVAQLLDVVSPAIEVTMVTRDRDLGATEPYPGLSGRWVRRGRTSICYLDVRRPRQWYDLLKTLRSTRFDLLYVNSLWATSSILAVLAARARLIRARQALIAPRGELAAGALGIKGRKKQLFLRAWRPFLKRSRVLWHATSPHEAQLIRNTFPWARVETRRNEVSLPPDPAVPHEIDGLPRLVFIGRISPIKNLATVIEALAQVTTPVLFDIYGPLEDKAYWAECKRLAERLPATVTLSYRGELAPHEVRPTFARYDAFVFPTKGENFGHVIAESLSASCPVICSDQTPWSTVLRTGGGAVLTDLTPAALAHQIDQVAGRTPAKRLDARLAAGAAYRSWRAESDGPNILDRIRLTTDVG
ncbi:glycosyltransferase family 4 protein [Micromonospora avicenniae]|uniref:glycosyltransferase family 4 protein n=1 Tax=Micromonospora avicenniae TaxID=1198245 RepID=UPI00343EBCC5